jgi:hypothetical protein
MRTLAMLASVVLAVGCNTGPERATPLPMVSDLGGPHMAHPQLVQIFFSDDPDVDTLTSFGQWVVTSDWLTAVGAEYGVGHGSVLGVIHRTEPAPDMITDAQIVDLLFQGLADGTLPRPAGGHLGDALYIVNLPAHTYVPSVGGSCVGFAGYHNSARRNGVELIYAVVATCMFPDLTALEGREFVTSHELIEAATDPVPLERPGIQLSDPTSTWNAIGIEVGDLCGGVKATWREAGFLAERTWSNVAAAVGDPCVPVPTSDPYYNVVVESHGLPRVPPGGEAEIKLTGWSTGAVPDWSLSIEGTLPDGATYTLAAETLNAGKTTTLKISSPPLGGGDAPNNGLQLFLVSARSQADSRVLPLLIAVDNPCSASTDCWECTRNLGCGFCAATGRCETAGANGSLESSCAATSFATRPGSCPGFCAHFSASCGGCTVEPGCGWCDSGGAGRCLEASPGLSQPLDGACPSADWSASLGYCPAADRTPHAQ